MSESIIKKYKILAKKSLGQNFLVNENITTEISKLISVSGKNIIEVGPGYGALTEKILEQNPKSLHLVELDRDMIEILEDRFTEYLSPTLPSKGRGQAALQISQQDILEFIPEFQDYSVIANIPYYITSPILRHFLYDVNYKPENMIILMQKDVGDKILSGSTPSPCGDFPLLKGKKKQKSSVLSLMIAKKCDVREEIFVGKENFIPTPKIESSVLQFMLHERYREIDDEKFLEVIKKGFLAPRKKLIKNLVSGGFEKNKIEEFLCRQGRNENMRGEDGDIDFWVELSKFLL